MSKVAGGGVRAGAYRDIVDGVIIANSTVPFTDEADTVVVPGF